MSKNGQKKKQKGDHPYLAGNFAPATTTCPPKPVKFSGVIPKELHGGMYVRNGGNPISNSDLGREVHWFDGDGMLTGVWFDRSSPQFVNQFVLTDLCLSSFENEQLRTPILPSIATLVSPFSSLVAIIWSILRASMLVLLSHLPGSQYAIKRISVANTGFLYHDGRALATCESGPPIRVQLPGLETVGWFDGNRAEGEPVSIEQSDAGPGFGGTGLNSWMREWTTGHPKVDPTTGEMMLFHCNFLPPFVHYSVIPRQKAVSNVLGPEPRKLINVPVPKCSGGKMMHDFGASKHHTVILDLPLSLSPFNLLKNQPVVAYEPKKPSRFGVFPRRDPSAVRWFETNGCCIFHTANTWDEYDSDNNISAVGMLACRLTSASLVFSAGNITPPPHPSKMENGERRPMSFFAKYDEDDQFIDPENIPPDEKTALLKTDSLCSRNSPPSPPISEDDHEQCRLYHYRFPLSPETCNTITDQYALSPIPFEFPTVAPAHDMSFARYVYGCSTSNASFGAALGKATKIDVIVKMDVHILLARARNNPPQNITGCVDSRSIQAILSSRDPADPIQAFKLPPWHYAQEARFVARQPQASEDDGYLLFYAFDESQLDEHGECREDARSELWVLDARDMQTVVCRVRLPTRVPYGLHGNWFSEEQIRSQRAVESVRKMPERRNRTVWGKARGMIMKALG
ncbi:carotenoid oxygenase [Trematosphaeria pertusa]|uniref:Carotenoid oxygenase n=1 Tax=Trematosphaeria pertusa TaxID=390896 RepID=A0A6A6HQU1_9PLEO|nr:carotenoid oxygenase [Trematosphaeria pertusa]KAF2240391.1 carotenoid oxygenase [Trematosphaeria pertusa]